MEKRIRFLAIGLVAVLVAAASIAHAFGKPAGSASEHGSAPAVPSGGTIKVDKASGPNAYTVAEIYAKAKALHGTTVVVRGQVAKISKAIMGKNWIHLRDGSGDPKDGTNNLVVTSKDVAAVGDIVTASGTLAKDKDFGSGYRYQAILENARVK